MYERAKYKELPLDMSSLTNDDVGMLKYDGGNYFARIEPDGSMRFISRRPSIKGGFPDRTESLPQLTEPKLKNYAGSILNVELIHTGKHPDAVESHPQVSGILNSLPLRARATQEVLGPVRAVLHNVVKPKLGTFQDKVAYMKEIEQAYGKPDLLFVPKLYHGKEQIKDLYLKTLAEGREGIVTTNWKSSEDTNVRHKIVHKINHNLVVVGIEQELDIHGQPKPSMGALKVADASGRVVGYVGTGFSRSQRQEAFNEPEKWLGKEIQVTSRGFAKNALRAPVFNGDSDGDIDLVATPVQ